EVVPLLAAERAIFLGGLIFRAAFLRGQCLRRRGGSKGEAGKRSGAKQFAVSIHLSSPGGMAGRPHRNATGRCDNALRIRAPKILSLMRRSCSSSVHTTGRLQQNFGTRNEHGGQNS